MRIRSGSAGWRGLIAALSALVVVPLTVVSTPSAAHAENGPSVPLPQTTSVSASQQSMGGRAVDEATSKALQGNQPASAGGMDGTGNAGATSLSPSATWNVAEQSGDFTWSYPLRVPPAPGGLEPSLNLTYSSSAVDGRTTTTNNQSSWIGDGWELAPGFVERSYGSCQDDKDGGTTPPMVGDLCWRSDNAVASYSGGGGQLIRDAGSQEWRAKSDDGSRVERITTAGNGDDNGESWKITTVNGTQFFFGTRPEAKSTWTVPVFGDDTGEPCHGATFDASSCAQAYRWNLDKVVDRHGNVMVYSYETELNSYGRNVKDTAASYVRGGYLKRIEYGLHSDVEGGAAGRVEFSVADRCVPGSDCTPAKKDNWPDIVWDNKCDTATCKDKYTPTFWSTKRLEKVTTQVRRGDGYTDVDSWTLEQQFPDPGDGEKASLWLKGIVHTGHVGDTIALPPVTFEGARMPNRVVKLDGYAPLNRYRITGIVSESGGVTSVKYAEPDCTATSLPAKPESNTKRCFPVRWNKKDHAERTDYFQKYVVEEVTTSDRIAANNEQVLRYEYLDGAAWHYDASEFTPADKKTWNEFRGFGRVRTRSGKQGDPSGPIGLVEQRFYRGMNGDHLPNGGSRTASVSDSVGGTRTDHDWLAGFGFESTTFDGDTTQVVNRTVQEPVWQGPTAVRADYKAYLVGVGTARTFTTLESGGPRETKTETKYDDRGIAVQLDDHGDVGVASDDRCTRTTYVRNDERWLIAFPSRIETVAVRCGATPSFPADAITDTKASYDGQAHGVAPVTGDVTTDERLLERPASGPLYFRSARIKYDAHGRIIERSDPLDRTAKFAYTPATGGPVTATTTTNAAGHAGTTTVEPAWGVPIVSVDVNSRRSEIAYDALGRTSELWQANRSRAAGHRGNARYTYLIRRDAPTVITATNLGPNGRYTSSNTIYDGLYRARQTQRPAIGGGRLITDTRYDSQGRVFKATAPYFNDADVDTNLWVASDVDVPGMTFTEYDGVGRPVASIFKGGGQEKWRTKAQYGGDRVHSTPPAGGVATTRIVDARGQLTKQRQYHGGAPTGAYDETAYTYDQSGHLATVTDPVGSRWRYTTDLRGLQTKVEDPDKGTSTSQFDAAGQVLSTTDARGSTLAFSYDTIGRRTGAYQDEVGGTKLAQWTYDTAAGGKGRLGSSTRWIGGNPYTSKVTAYNPLYQPVVKSVVVPESEGALAGSYLSVLKYNDDGSAKGLSYPAGGGLAEESVSYTYDDNARPVTTSGALNGRTIGYVSDTQYTRFGEAQRIQLGEGTKRAWLSYYYEDHTRRLKRYIVDAEVSRPMQADLNYSYDATGNVLSIADTPQDKPADNQCFRYDYLRRMTEAWTPTGGCEAAPAKETLGGPAPFWQSFRFDKVGNRTSEVDHAAAGDTTRTYHYPPVDPADEEQSGDQPHALTSVETSGPAGDTVDEFDYDAAGNTTSRKVGGQTQQLSWSPEGQLSKVTEGAKTSEYVYDATGSRLLRRDPTGTTLYLGAQELRLDKASGQVSATRYYTHGGKVVATRGSAGVSWLAGDHQGTQQIAIDSGSLAVQHRRQTPFGESRGANVDFPGERGFVGGTVDKATDLVHLGAREYDPSTGRFLSVDPLFDTEDPQQMQGYLYANNSPITFSDPTGQIWFPLEQIIKTITQVVEWWRDNTLRHNAVVQQTKTKIQAQVVARGGNPANVKTEVAIPGASKKANGNVGFADIVYTETVAGADGKPVTTIYIWEVKSDSYDAKTIQDEVNHYISHMQAQSPKGTQVVSGWDIAQTWTFPYTNTAGQVENVTVWGGGPSYPGAVLYRSDRKKEEKKKEEPQPPAIPAPNTRANEPPKDQKPPTMSGPERAACAQAGISACDPSRPPVVDPDPITVEDVLVPVAVVGAGVAAGVAVVVGAPVIAAGLGLGALAGLVFG